LRWEGKIGENVITRVFDDFEIRPVRGGGGR